MNKPLSRFLAPRPFGDNGTFVEDLSYAKNVNALSEGAEGFDDILDGVGLSDGFEEAGCGTDNLDFIPTIHIRKAVDRTATSAFDVVCVSFQKDKTCKLNGKRCLQLYYHGTEVSEDLPELEI